MKIEALFTLDTKLTRWWPNWQVSINLTRVISLFYSALS